MGFVCIISHRDFTRQLLWALWRHVISLLSRSRPDRASSSTNPPGGGASPTGGRNFCFASLVVMSIVRTRLGVCFILPIASYTSTLSRSCPLRASSSLNPPAGGASLRGGRHFLSCVVRGGAIDRGELILCIVVSRTLGGFWLFSVFPLHIWASTTCCSSDGDFRQDGGELHCWTAILV